MEGLSDEAVCKRWVENPYFQYFCGEQYFRHRLVLDRSSMTRWRGRIGADQLELLLAETLSVAMRTQAVTEQAMERVTLDTTVQTKAVAHPTDSHLLMRSIELLNRLAKKHRLVLRQSFLRVGRRARRDVSRLIHGRGHKQAMRWVRKMQTWLGRLDRDIGRKIAGDEALEAALRGYASALLGCLPKRLAIPTSCTRCTRPWPLLLGTRRLSSTGRAQRPRPGGRSDPINARRQPSFPARSKYAPSAHCFRGSR